MSLKPGIGADACWDIASEMLRYDLQERLVDVPLAIGHGRKNLPLGRYLRNKLRLMLDKELGAPQEVIDAAEKELLPLRLAAKASAEFPSFKGQILEVNKGSVATLEARENIFRKRREL